MRTLDKYRGCLLGGGAGDALGYVVEFQSRRSIIDRYGPRGITDYELHGGVAEISDDTQMTLFTAAGLLRAGAGGTEGRYSDCIHACYRDWYRTQTEPYPLAGRSGTAGWSTCRGSFTAGPRGTPASPPSRTPPMGR